MTSKSLTFSAYNRATNYYGKEDRGRTNRALGITQANGGIENKVYQYNTTLTDCNCPDRQYRHVVCKHMRALQIREKTTNPEHVLDLVRKNTHQKINRIIRKHGDLNRYHSLVNIRYYATKSVAENAPQIAEEIAQKLGMTVQEAIEELSQANH